MYSYPIFTNRVALPSGCLPLFVFSLFYTFLAKSWPFNGSVWRSLICERTNYFHFSARSGKIWRRWPATATRFFSPPDWLFHMSLFNHRAEPPQEEPPPPKANQRCRHRRCCHRAALKQFCCHQWRCHLSTHRTTTVPPSLPSCRRCRRPAATVAAAAASAAALPPPMPRCCCRCQSCRLDFVVSVVAFIVIVSVPVAAATIS